MSAFVSLPSSGTFRLSDLFGVIDFITTEGDISSRFTTSFFGITGNYNGIDMSVSVNGSNFTYGLINGSPAVTGAPSPISPLTAAQAISPFRG